MKYIELTRGQRTLVDDEDYEWLSKISWIYHHRGYAYQQTYIGGGRANPKYKKIWIHRLITDCPDNKIVDHINRDRLDNRRANLRICTQSENQMNAKIRDNNTSGYRGVNRLSGKWSARIKLNGKRVYLGLFNTPNEASEAYERVAQEHYGEFANNNMRLT